jgi:hypothetical protein
MKTEGLVARNTLQRVKGDAVNASLCVIGDNAGCRSPRMRVTWRACSAALPAPSPASSARSSRAFNGAQGATLSPRRRPLIATDSLPGALWDPLDGDIDPARLCKALARRARRRGLDPPARPRVEWRGWETPMTHSLCTQDEIAAFRRDGAALLKGKFDPSWIEMLREGVDADMADPSPTLTRHTRDPDAPAYWEDFWVWSRFPQFERFVRRSPCAPIAAELLGAPSVNLVMDNWFLREAGSASRPPFHQDLAYFDFEGTMCVLWLPLEPVSKENGIAFIRGSHLWDKLFMRVRFGDGHRADAGACMVNGREYHLPPDVEADPGAYDLLQWDLDLGDCIYFDMRTLHGGLSTVTPTETVRRFTLRMTAPDGVIRYRGDWAKGERAMFEAAGYREGDRIAGEFFPQLWPRAESAIE